MSQVERVLMEDAFSSSCCGAVGQVSGERIPSNADSCHWDLASYSSELQTKLTAYRNYSR